MSEPRRRRPGLTRTAANLNLNLSVLEPWRSNAIQSGHCAGRRGPAGAPGGPAQGYRENIAAAPRALEVSVVRSYCASLSDLESSWLFSDQLVTD